MIETCNMAQAAKCYREKGAVCLSGVLDRDTVLRMRNFFAEICKDNPSTRPLGQHAMIVREQGTVFLEFLAREYQLFRDVVSDSPIAELTATIIQSRRLTFWRDELLYKSPSQMANATPWHHGIASIPFKGRQVPTVWIPLMDISSDCAPLLTLDGTHRHTTRRIAPPTRSNDNLLPGYQTSPDFDALVNQGKLQKRFWTPKMGDAVIFHPYTIHGSGPNKSDHGRLAYITRWLGEDAIWAPDDYSVIDRNFDPDSMLVDGRLTGPWFTHTWDGEWVDKK